MKNKRECYFNTRMKKEISLMYFNGDVIITDPCNIVKSDEDWRMCWRITRNMMIMRNGLVPVRWFGDFRERLC